jgi:hypothetical protein
MSSTERLLLRTSRRLRLSAIARSLYIAFLGLCAVYLAVLLASRISGAIPDWFQPARSLTFGSGESPPRLIGYEPIALCAIPLAALLIALAFHRRPTPVDAARRLDRQSGTKDLYLNASLLETSPGEFRPLVAQAAEEHAKDVDPARIVPYGGARRIGYAAIALLVVLTAAQHFPHFDPFGNVEAAESVKKDK